MGRSITSSGGDIANAAFTTVGAAGTISVWHKPNWSSGDSVRHYLWSFGGQASNEAPGAQQFSDNNCYIGFIIAGVGDQRIAVSSAGFFVSGQWANFVFTWTTAGNNQTIYRNAVSKGTNTFAGFVNLATGFDIGATAFAATDPDASFADFAFWSVVLTAGEISALAAGARPGTIRPASLTGWLPLDGLQSPEPDFGGGKYNGTLTTANAASGPPMMMFTPRWPNNELPAAAAPSFIPAWAAGSNLPVLGTGNF